jgi:hypothetical protein
MKVRVKEGHWGFFGYGTDLRRRKEGEVFDIKSEKEFSKIWMEKVEPKKGESEAKEPEKPKKAGRPPKSGKSTGDRKVL